MILTLQIMISSLLDTLVFFWFNRKIETRRNMILNGILYYVGIDIFVEGMNRFGINTIFYRIILLYIFNLAAIYITCRVSVKKAITRTNIWVGCTVLAECSISILIMIQQKSGDLEGMMHTITFWIIQVVLVKSIEVVLLNFIGNSSLENKRWNFLLLLGILLYLYFILYCFMRGKVDYTILGIAFITNIAFCYVIFGGIFIFAKMNERQKVQAQEIELLSVKAREQTECYTQMIAYKQKIQKLYHDLKNHMLVAGSIQDENTQKKYLDSLSEYFGEVLEKVDSGNEILDLLLEKKKKECQEKEIEFSCKVDFSKGYFINLVDVCAIFGNILDNAIEACEHQKAEDKRIHLSVGNYENFIFIKLENPTDMIVQKNGKLITRKAEKEKHGLGLASLEDALKKYDGTYQYEVEENRFRMMIVIPVKLQKD